MVKKFNNIGTRMARSLVRELCFGRIGRSTQGHFPTETFTARELIMQQTEMLCARDGSKMENLRALEWTTIVLF